MIKRRRPPSQGWRTFLRNHAPDVAAMDLLVVPTIGFDLLYAFVIVRRSGGSFSQLSAPAKQLLRRKPMAPGHGTDRVTARFHLRNNPNLVLIAPLPPASSSREDFQPPRRLRDSIIHCVLSKPRGQSQTVDSQIRTSSGRRPQNDAYLLCSDKAQGRGERWGLRACSQRDHQKPW
jgi:hypothetical protein